MTHASCPSAVVGAPIEIVWLLLTDPARWGEPNGFVRQIHTRMPVILPEEHHDAGGVTTVVVVLED